MNCIICFVSVLVPFLWYLGNLLDKLTMGSFILRGEIWTRTQFQASLLMILISVSGITGKHEGEHGSLI